MASPLFALPDEPSHITRAASIVRGQLLGREASAEELPEASPYLRGIIRFVDVPSILDEAGTFHPSLAQHVPCYAFNPDQHAGCLAYGRDTGETSPVSTTAGEHPPLWYALIGVPSLFSVESAGVYAMRLLNVAVVAAFLASAAISLAWEGSAFSRIGLIFALTPMVYFLAGGVNSSGPEIASAIALWTGMVVVLQNDQWPNWLPAICGVSATFLATMRRSGPIWLAMILMFVFLAFGTRRVLVKLMESRLVRVWTIITCVAVAFQVIWMVAVGALSSESVPGSRGPLSAIVQMSIGHSYQKLVNEVVGVFGWLDAPAPAVVPGLWLVGIGGLMALGLSGASRRAIRVLGLLALTVFGSLLFFEIAEAGDRLGFWQGRYSMPLAVGLPILFGQLSFLSSNERYPRFRYWACSIFVAGHTVAFFQYLKRHMVGVRGSSRFLWESEWSPPVHAVLLVLVYAVASGVLAACLSAPSGTATSLATVAGEPSRLSPPPPSSKSDNHDETLSDG